MLRVSESMLITPLEVVVGEGAGSQALFDGEGEPGLMKMGT